MIQFIQHSTSTTDLPQSTPGEHTTVFEEFEKPLQGMVLATMHDHDINN